MLTTSKCQESTSLKVFHLITDEENERGLLVIAQTHDQAVAFYDTSRLRDAFGKVSMVTVFAENTIELQWDNSDCGPEDDPELAAHFAVNEEDDLLLPVTKTTDEWAHLLGPGLLAAEEGDGGCGNLGGGIYTVLRPFLRTL